PRCPSRTVASPCKTAFQTGAKNIAKVSPCKEVDMLNGRTLELARQILTPLLNENIDTKRVRQNATVNPAGTIQPEPTGEAFILIKKRFRVRNVYRVTVQP